MRSAAIIYVFSALGLLALDVTQAFARGIDIGILLTLVVVAAFMVVGVSLVRGNPKARWPAFYCSLAVALSFGAIAAIILSSSLPLSLNDPVSRSILWLIIKVGSVSLAHLVAAVLLVKSKPGRPNPSLNVDVPRAGLRPRSGPPVS